MCEYCDFKEVEEMYLEGYLFGKGLDCIYLRVAKSKKDGTYNIIFAGGEEIGESNEIKYCPMCGRELV